MYGEMDPTPNNHPAFTSGIRPYKQADRNAVREIAYETSQRASDGSPLITDKQLLADILTAYYTEYEPWSCWVAVQSGKVIGYLSGCTNTARYNRHIALRVLPGTATRAIVRGTLWRQETRRMFNALLRTGFERRRNDKVDLRPYPAHLHINLSSAARGGGLGRKLVALFLEQLSELRVTGVHASVRADNEAALGFFLRMGFEPIGQLGLVLPDLDGYLHTANTIMARPINSHDLLNPSKPNEKQTVKNQD
jgi:ribosomal protein S18 acetylase RimI-like enzyme